MNMRVAFFHGLESKPFTEKNQELIKHYGDPNVYAPAMDYKDPWLFDTILKQVRERNIELLIGSSMGGYFSYCLSTMTGIPTVLFNPAVIGRSFDPVVEMGLISSKHRVILGVNDDVIDPIKSLAYFTEYGIGEFEYHREDIAHRIPIEVFKRWAI
jgi:hypothetical protein